MMTTVHRRRFLTLLGGFGVAAAVAERLWAAAQRQPLTRETLAAALEVAGVEFSEAQRELMLKGVEELRRQYEQVRRVPLPNAVAPALGFRLPPPPPAPSRLRPSRPGRLTRPNDPETLAFLPVTQLSQLVRSRQVTAQELTELYLARLKEFDPLLQCVVTLTEERALAQAKRADRELAEGRWRGPLHGIPWGAKDLLAVRGYPTTWGARPYRGQVLDEDATVVRRLDEAGAILVAKLTLGELAMGDVWFGGTTKNPWKLDQGSSGSSAGSAAAVAAGLVAFAIGSETRGSILSPCTRCGVTGLRPTFGTVPRTGAMALAWSMDKLGPIARTAEDCALVFNAIRGGDGVDDTVVEAPFVWDADTDVGHLRVGYLASLFQRPLSKDDDPEWRAHEGAALEVLRSLGIQLHPLELPELPIDALSFILTAEAAAAFDELTRSGGVAQLTRQDERAWPNIFRQAQTIPAVEYIQANRVRRLAMQKMDRLLAGFDAYVSPTYGGANLLLTNLTGHPAVVLPIGFRADRTPTSISFCGNLFREDAAVALAHAFQRVTGFHRRRPPLPDSSGTLPAAPKKPLSGQ